MSIDLFDNDSIHLGIVRVYENSSLNGSGSQLRFYKLSYNKKFITAVAKLNKLKCNKNSVCADKNWTRILPFLVKKV